jgi:hypothetical protein
MSEVCHRGGKLAHTKGLNVILDTQGKRREQGRSLEDEKGVHTSSKLPSTYLTIRLVFPICESPTIPTLMTTLESQIFWSTDKYTSIGLYYVIH